MHKKMILNTLAVFVLSLPMSVASAEHSEPTESDPEISSWDELDEAAATTGIFIRCSKHVQVDRGLICETAEDVNDTEAEIRLNRRLESSWLRSVEVEGRFITPDDGRKPREVAARPSFAHLFDGQRRNVDDVVTHIETCYFVNRPYTYESLFFDSHRKRLCVRLTHDDTAWKSFVSDLRDVALGFVK